LQLQRLLDAAGVDLDVTGNRQPPPRPKHKLTLRQLFALRRGAAKRNREIKAFGSSVAMRKFGRLVAKKFEAFLPPCPHCTACDERLEGDQIGMDHFCTDCIVSGRADTFTNQRIWEGMRKYFGLKPHQRLSPKRIEQFWKDQARGLTPTEMELIHGSQIAKEIEAARAAAAVAAAQSADEQQAARTR
jgi:hypothetical protein